MPRVEVIDHSNPPVIQDKPIDSPIPPPPATVIVFRDLDGQTIITQDGFTVARVP